MQSSKQKPESKPPVRSGELVSLVREMLEIFNRVEVSDCNEREFHPTTIRSCRVMDSERLREIFIRMDRLTKTNARTEPRLPETDVDKPKDKQ